MKRLVISLLASLLVFWFWVLPTLAQEGTTPGETVRDRVRERVELLARRPRAYVGEIVDLPDSIIEIETRSGQMRQAKTDEETVFIQVKAGVSSNITFEDLAVADWVIAMGYLGDNNVLEARRVITTGTSPLIERRAVYGVVEEADDGTFTIKHPKTGETWIVETSATTRVTSKEDTEIVEADVEDIGVGDRIIAAGTPSEEEDTIEARLVHIIPGLAEGLAPTPTATP